MANEYAQLIRERKLPLVGDGAGIWSFVHADDAASATVLAVEGGAPRRLQRGRRRTRRGRGVAALPGATFLGARPPRHVPAWLARFAIGDVGVAMMTRIRGSSNAKAKRELGFGPVWPSWRRGFPGRVRRPAPAIGRLGVTDDFLGTVNTKVSSSGADMTETFEDLRPLLFSISYRMLGSVAEAEDVVQDAFLRYQRALVEQGAEIESPKAYLSAVTTRLVDRPPPLGARPQGELHRRVAARAAAHRHERARRGHSTRRTPTRSRWRSCSCSSGSHRSSARSSCCTTSSTTATTRSRPSSARARTTAASSPCAHGGTSTSTSPGSRRRGASASGSPTRFFDAVEDGDMDGLVELLAADVVVLRRRRRHQPVVAQPDLRPRQGRAADARPRPPLARARRHDPPRRDQRPAGRRCSSTPAAG